MQLALCCAKDSPGREGGAEFVAQEKESGIKVKFAVK